MSIKTRYLSPREFSQVSLAFLALDYTRPKPDAGNSPDGGAFVNNLIGQYHADLSEREVIAIVQSALQSPGMSGTMTLAEIVSVYGED